MNANYTSFDMEMQGIRNPMINTGAQNQQQYQPGLGQQQQYSQQQGYTPNQGYQQQYTPQQQYAPYPNQGQNDQTYQPQFQPPPPQMQPVNFYQQPQVFPVQPQQIPQGTPVMIINRMRGKNAFEKLSCPAVFIKQKFEAMEVVTGCETENKYKIYTSELNSLKPKQIIFKAKEKSGCFERQCLDGNCRPFKLKISHESENDDDNDGDQFLLLTRECACTVACLNRPTMTVTLTEQGNKYLGKLVNSYSLYDVKFEVRDETDALKFYLSGPLCQLGLTRSPFSMCSKTCQEAYFFVYDNQDTKVGMIQKKGKECQSVISDADNFLVVFPLFATLQDRALLMSLALMLDFCFFEDGPNPQKNKNISINIT